MEKPELRPNDRRAKNAIALIWAVIITNVVATFLDIGGSMIFGDEYHNDYYDESNIPLIVYLLFVGFASFASFATYITSAVTFIMWFRRAYYNLNQTNTITAYGDGWAAGAWFVPIMNLFVPYKIMKELYESTNRIFQQNLKTVSIQLKTSYLGIWWTLWITTNIIDQILFRLTLNDVINPFVSSMSLVSMLLTLICGIITVRIIKDYSNIEPLIEGAFDDDEYNIHKESVTESDPVNS